MVEDWPFDESPDAEAITLTRIVRGEAPVRLVTHDEDDGAWQFLVGELVAQEVAVFVDLIAMVQHDPGLVAVLDLPLGWYAWRAEVGLPWHRGPGEAPAGL
jgi:hypothetical protein